MLNRFCKTPLWECNDELVRVAQGERPADLVIRHANLVSVTTHEILPDTDIAVACGRVAYLGLGEHTAEHRHQGRGRHRPLRRPGPHGQPHPRGERDGRRG